MNISDVSDHHQWLPFLEQIQSDAKKSMRRKGEMVRDHRPKDEIVTSFNMKLSAGSHHSGPAPSGRMAHITQVPAPYLPCIVPAQDLEPMMISDMRLETHHRGKKVLLRVLTQPCRTTAVMAVVEDEHETAVALQLYHQPDESLVSETELLGPGKICILKEPFFKCTTDGTYSLRVDHLSDIIWLSENDERIPLRWRQRTAISHGASRDIRMQGNYAVQSQDWALAQRLYSNALQTAKTPEEAHLASLNRSLANLKLGRPEKALSDAARGHDPTAPTEKSLFREARALYELGDFDQSFSKLQLLAKSYPDNKAAGAEMDRVKARLDEQHKGEYSFRSMYDQAKMTPPLIECATFSSSVEVRQSPGRGRGLFTVKPVSAGELVLCEKAFGYSHADSTKREANVHILMNLWTKKVTIGDQALLWSQIVQKLHHNPDLSRAFLDLYHGDYQPVGVSECDGVPVLDSFLVERIICVNAFAAPRTSRDTYQPSNALGMESPVFETVGVWLLASRINHSCVGNCDRSFIGDMQIIRATRDVPAGTELVFSYRHPIMCESYQEAQKAFGNWGFTCNCELCMEKKGTSQTALQRRRALVGDLKQLFDSSHIVNASKARRLLNDLEQTYSGKEFKAPRLELAQYCIAFGSDLVDSRHPQAGIGMIVKGLEALGFSIIACPPGENAGQPKLEVKRWGMARESLPWAFLQLSRAYETLAPELCLVAQRYVKMSYSMFVGGEEICQDTVSELALQEMHLNSSELGDMLVGSA